MIELYNFNIGFICNFIDVQHMKFKDLKSKI